MTTNDRLTRELLARMDLEHHPMQVLGPDGWGPSVCAKDHETWPCDTRELLAPIHLAERLSKNDMLSAYRAEHDGESAGPFFDRLLLFSHLHSPSADGCGGYPCDARHLIDFWTRTVAFGRRILDDQS